MGQVARAFVVFSRIAHILNRVDFMIDVYVKAKRAVAVANAGP